MEYVLNFLSKPIVLTLISLTIGSYLFTRLTEIRSKKEKIREKSLQLLEEVGTDVNSVISSIYGHIRDGNFQIQRKSPLDQKRGDLFRKRFSVRIRSEVFLNSDEFWQRYEDLTFELDSLVRFMMSLSKEYELESVVNQIKAKQEQFAISWPDQKERSLNPKYPPPSGELKIWADMIWDRANSLIVTNLNKIFR